MYHYGTPPVEYVRHFEYTTSGTTSPSSSPSHEGYAYYRPQHKPSPTSPISRNTTTKRHSRKDSYTGPAGWHSPAGYPSPSYYASLPAQYASPPAYQYHVSEFGRDKGKARRFPIHDHRGGGNTQHHASMQSPTQRIIIDTSDEAEDLPTYTYIKPKARSSHKTKKSASANANFFFNQESRYAEPSDSQPQRSRARRSSQSTNIKPTTKKAAKPPPPPEATAADAAKAGIPAGYSIKNWDPTESPILLLGSVFDANSLGKWIYDWTVFHHGAATPMSEVAGDLWLLLIKLAGKMKRADECLPRIRAVDNQEMVEDFLESGDRLWGRFKKLLKACEEFMWKAAKREGSKGTVKMGKNSGCEFVDSIFGRDRELENTESLMQSIRLWNLRFDANCEDILRRPSAA